MKWHHSLYWRIAVGFVACLALLLVVQAVLFVWVAGRTTPSIPNQPPERFAQTVALELTRALELDPALDLVSHVRQEYSEAAQPFFVLLTDRRLASVGGPWPDGIVEESQNRLDAMVRGGAGRGSRGRGQFRGDPPFPPSSGGRGFRGDGPPPGDGPFPGPRGGGGLRPFRPAPIFDGDRLVGIVVVPPQPPFVFLLARYAPTLGLVALVTLVVGALVATVAIFGPARRRLREVEEAARRLGAGDLSARAPARGQDEVAAVAGAFNAMAEDLNARAQALAASDRARRQLLADVSHELNTPVTAMRGYLETLAMKEMGLDEATRAHYLSIVTDETIRLERIIGDLLDLARLEGGAGPLNLAETSVAALFARVSERHERALDAANVRLDTHVAADAQVLTTDRDRLEQALQNLVANALRFAPEGTAIELASHRDGDAIVLSVTDAGAGIPEEHVRHIFDRFYKADASRAVRESPGDAGGSGLGLSIVKAIVERHGGTATVRSEAGRTVFELRIAAASPSHGRKAEGAENADHSS